VLTSRFPSTYFGKLEKADLARGFTEHYFGTPEFCPTPLPSGVTPPPTMPQEQETPTPAPGQPKIDVITPPCVQPSPSETPMAMPMTTPTTTPSPSASP
jgi:hypothetical protein